MVGAGERPSRLHSDANRRAFQSAFAPKMAPANYDATTVLSQYVRIAHIDIVGALSQGRPDHVPQSSLLDDSRCN
jgi:hypothetical protein